MNPLVSIIIPVFNNANHLEETIQSALNQSWTNKELIIIDDGSTDNSLEIAKRFSGTTVKVFGQSNNGASSARNRGLKEANGDYIQFLDADDLLSKEKIENQLEMLRGKPNSLLCSGSWGRFTNDIQQTKYISGQLWKDLTPYHWILTSLNTSEMIPLHSWLIPREIIVQAGAWDEDLSYNDDGEFMSRVILKSTNILFCRQSFAYYRSGYAGTQSSIRNTVKANSAVSAADSMARHILDIFNTGEMQVALANMLQRLRFTLFPDFKEEEICCKQMLRKLECNPSITFEGTPLEKSLSKIIGWKGAKIIRRYIYYAQRKS
jgi:glycosyltransferase involved in cell wall biosynthesis